MANNLVLRWEIDNDSILTGEAESGVFDEGGFRWTATVKRRNKSGYQGYADFTLRCEEHVGPWKCEADVNGVLLDSYGRVRFCFNESNYLLDYKGYANWIDLYYQSSQNGKAIFEFHIDIISSDRGGPKAGLAKFIVPSDMSNVILKIEDKKLHVSKEYPAVQSQFFMKLFFGEFAEKGKEEVEIKDVKYEEFVDLLHLIYLETAEITDRTVIHILKLADQFHMERVMNLCEKHLTHSKAFDAVTKLRLADQYRFTSLKDHCLKSFSIVTDLLGKLKLFPEYANFSEGLKATICDRLVKL